MINLKNACAGMVSAAAIAASGTTGYAQVVEANLRMWFDLSDAATVTLDTSGMTTVSRLNNKAASGGFIANTVKGEQPQWLAGELNGHPAMRFDGTNDVLRNTAFSSTPMAEATIYMVVAPMSDNGGFPALLSLDVSGGNDYLTGINVDLGEGFQNSFSYLNIEGPKLITPGGRNYRTRNGPFGDWHIIQVNYWSTRLELVIDGVHEGRVTFTAPAQISTQELRIGARYYGGGERGYADIKIAEALVYDSAADCDALNQTALYLAAKYGISTTYLPRGCPADFNADCTVDFFDYLDFVDAFSTGRTGADFNHDSVLDFFDYLDFVDAFSTGC